MSGPRVLTATLLTGLLMLAGARRSGWASGMPPDCKGMSVRDMVGVARFLRGGDLEGGEGELARSPDGRYVVGVTQRGDFGTNSALATLRVWSMRAILSWLRGGAKRPSPVLRVSLRANSQMGYWSRGNAVISDVEWSADSGHLVFLGRRHAGRSSKLYRVSLTGHVRQLSAPHQDVELFSMDESGIVYQTAETTEGDLRRAAALEDARPYFVGTGLSLYRLLFPTSWAGGADRVQLWQVHGGSRSRIRVLPRHWDMRDYSRRFLIPSPAGGRLLMDLPVRFVPQRWLRYGRAAYPVWSRTGAVPYADVDQWIPHQYVIIDRRTGRVRAVVAAPDGGSRGFWGGVPGDPRPGPGEVWAPDGRAILLWNTFLPPQARLPAAGRPWGSGKPCLAVVDIASSRSKCAEALWRKGSAGTLIGVRWRKGPPDRLILTWLRGRKTVQVPYCLSGNSVNWIGRCGRVRSVRRTSKQPRLRIRVAQGIDSPPEIVAALGGAGAWRVLFDPNARVRKRCIGHVQTITLDLGSRNRIEAGLLLPLRYVPGRRYPLVIQTHGYDPRRFLTTGYSPPFAARAFAASGMAVMQLPECSEAVMGRAFDGTTAEIPCNLAIFRAAIRYANAHGFADPARIGIIGFSATCEHVLAALEKTGFHFGAAELVDGVMTTYSQFVDDVDLWQGFDNAFETQQMGGPPIGSDLREWIARAAGFSIDKIATPLLIQANGRIGVLEMWEPYAVLRYMGRPVDLVVLQHGSHPASNPAQEFATEQLGVDWFRFWLEGKRPASESEYRRWSKLRAAWSGKAGAAPRA